MTRPAVAQSVRFVCAIVIIGLANALFATSASAAVFTWSSTTTGTNWNVAANWGGTVPGSTDIGLFSSASYTSQPSLVSAASIGGVWDTGSGAVTIGGTNALTLFGTTINSKTGTGIEIDASVGSLTINAPLVLQNNQQWINNSATPFTLNGGISGTGSLTTIGSGMLILTGSNTFGGSMTVDGGTVQIPSGSLSTTSTGINGNEYIGQSGSGSITQSGGTNSVAVNLFFGANTGSDGTYNLTGNGLLSALNEYLGDGGSASFTQSGGTNVTGTTYLGNYNGSAVPYRLSGGLLSVGQEFIRGNTGNGGFTESGGTNSVLYYLYLGLDTGQIGTYNLSGNGLVSAPYEYIGRSGSGSFTQSGGTNTAGSLVLAQSASLCRNLQSQRRFTCPSFTEPRFGNGCLQLQRWNTSGQRRVLHQPGNDTRYQWRRSDVQYGRLFRDAFWLAIWPRQPDPER